MRGIPITVCTLVILAAAGNAAVLLQTGFEAPDYVLGNLNGQQGWGGDTYSGEAIITDTLAGSGTQSLLILGDGSPTGYSELGGHCFFPYDPLGAGEPLVTLKADTYLLSAPSGEGFSFWVWDVYGYQLAGHILLQAGDNVAVMDASGNVVGTGVPCVAGAWVPLQITSDYTAGTFDVLYNGVLAVNDMGFQTVGSDAVNDLWIGVENLTLGGAMYVDNLQVTATRSAAVPEPMSLWLLGLGMASLLRRRQRT